jgi:hypothetical protein
MATIDDCVKIGRNQVGEITGAVKSPILLKKTSLDAE